MPMNTNVLFQNNKTLKYKVKVRSHAVAENSPSHLQRDLRLRPRIRLRVASHQFKLRQVPISFSSNSLISLSSLRMATAKGGKVNEIE